MHFILGKACNSRIMFPINSTNLIFSTFLMSGIPGLEAVHIWISIPVCAMFFITLVGNVTIIAVISVENRTSTGLCTSSQPC